MRVCNAGQPNLKEHVPRVGLIYRSALVNYAKSDAYWYSFCILLRGSFEFFFKIAKYKKSVLAMVLCLPITPYFALIHERSKNFFKILFFAVEKNRQKPAIWKSKNRLH